MSPDDLPPLDEHDDGTATLIVANTFINTAGWDAILNAVIVFDQHGYDLKTFEVTPFGLFARGSKPPRLTVDGYPIGKTIDEINLEHP
jgi:hypothetical protein